MTTVENPENSKEPQAYVAEEVSFPEGGIAAWTVTIGGFCAFFAAFEMVNSAGTYQNWIATHQLQHYEVSSIGWIFGLNLFIVLFGGVLIGPVCDSIGPRIPLCTGSLLCVLSYGLVGLCSKYWHFILVLGFLSGLATSLLFVPTVLTIGQYFSRRRGLATGLSYSGGSFGGIVVPIVLQALLPKLGFAWATRVIGLITLVLVCIACLLVRPRLPSTRKRLSLAVLLPQWSLYKNATFATTSLAMFFLDLALTIPLAYLPSYAIAAGISEGMAFYTLTFLNAGSCVGRWVPAYASDVMGRFNTMILTVALCAISSLTLWLLAGSNVAVVITYAVVFGFASGSNLSLAPVCVGQLCDIKEYGVYYSTAIILSSFGSLVGNPIAGAILNASNGHYWGLIVFTGVIYAIGALFFSLARSFMVGCSLRKKF